MVVIFQRSNPLQLFPVLPALFVLDKSACFTVQLLCCPIVQYMEVVNEREKMYELEMRETSRQSEKTLEFII